MTNLRLRIDAHRKAFADIYATRMPWLEFDEESLSDGRVGDDVANALYWDLAVPRDRVLARCDYGWVTLTGEVERAYQRSSAEADAQRVHGVRGVINAIIVNASAS